MKWPDKVQIKEVGPRDGLQNEQTFVPTKDKIAWINQLSDTGISYLEITSFVSPRWIPSLSDAVEVTTGIRRKTGVKYAALVPNRYGLECALEASVDEVSVFISASESHNKKNVNKNIAETLKITASVARSALEAGKTVRGYISTVFGCPYEGNVQIEDVIRVVDVLLEMNVSEVSLGDTIGIANPRQVEEMLNILLKRYDGDRLALHFHDTHGRAMANIIIAMQMGIARFDAAIGGLGGCPYAPGASGNVATEDVVSCMEQMGIDTGINLAKLLTAAQFIENRVRLPRKAILYP